MSTLQQLTDDESSQSTDTIIPAQSLISLQNDMQNSTSGDNPDSEQETIKSSENISSKTPLNEIKTITTSINVSLPPTSTHYENNSINNVDHGQTLTISSPPLDLALNSSSSNPTTLISSSPSVDSVDSEPTGPQKSLENLQSNPSHSLLNTLNHSTAPLDKNIPLKVSKIEKKNVKSHKKPVVSVDQVDTPQFLDSPHTQVYSSQKHNQNQSSQRSMRPGNFRKSPFSKKPRLSKISAPSKSLCFQCGGSGHFAKECTSPRNAVSNPNMSLICQFCHGKGHAIIVCPTKKWQQKQAAASFKKGYVNMFHQGISHVNPQNHSQYGFNVHHIVEAPSTGYYDSKTHFKSTYKPTELYGQSFYSQNWSQPGPSTQSIPNLQQQQQQPIHSHPGNFGAGQPPQYTQGHSHSQMPQPQHHQHQQQHQHQPQHQPQHQHQPQQQPQQQQFYSSYPSGNVSFNQYSHPVPLNQNPPYYSHQQHPPQQQHIQQPYYQGPPANQFQYGPPPQLAGMYPVEESFATRTKPGPTNTICFRCRQPGHWSKECPHAPPLESPDACWRCRRTGHKARDCTTCFICRQQGHKARDCPNNQQNRQN